jgi:hypothetical protein
MLFTTLDKLYNRQINKQIWKFPQIYGKFRHAPLAQWIERVASDHKVEGSNPSGREKYGLQNSQRNYGGLE